MNQWVSDPASTKSVFIASGMVIAVLLIVAYLVSAAITAKFTKLDKQQRELEKILTSDEVLERVAELNVLLTELMSPARRRAVDEVIRKIQTVDEAATIFAGALAALGISVGVILSPVGEWVKGNHPLSTLGAWAFAILRGAGVGAGIFVVAALIAWLAHSKFPRLLAWAKNLRRRREHAEGQPR
jgi:hypothetical protein